MDCFVSILEDWRILSRTFLRVISQSGQTAACLAVHRHMSDTSGRAASHLDTSGFINVSYTGLSDGCVMNRTINY